MKIHHDPLKAAELAGRAEARHNALQLLKRYADPASTVTVAGKNILRRAAQYKATGVLQWPGASTRAFNPDPIAVGDVVLIRARHKTPMGVILQDSYQAVVTSVERFDATPNASVRRQRTSRFLYIHYKPDNSERYHCAWGTTSYYLDGEPQPEWGASVMTVWHVDVTQLPNEV